MKVRLLMLALLVAATAARAQPDPTPEVPPGTAAPETIVPGADAPGLGPTAADPTGVDPAGVDPAGVDPTGVNPSGVDPAEARSLDDLLWIARPLVIFADTDRDPRFIQQMLRIEAGMEELSEREVVVLTDTDPAAAGPLRRALRPRGFGVVLIDIDGRVALRRPAPMQVREISSLIDRMPSRRDETGSRRP